MTQRPSDEEMRDHYYQSALNYLRHLDEDGRMTVMPEVRRVEAHGTTIFNMDSTLYLDSVDRWNEYLAHRFPNAETSLVCELDRGRDGMARSIRLFDAEGNLVRDWTIDDTWRGLVGRHRE